MAHTFALGSELVGLLDTRTIPELAALAAQDPRVVEVLSGPHNLRIRVEGAPPIWVSARSGYGIPGSPGQAASPYRSDAAAGAEEGSGRGIHGTGGAEARRDAPRPAVVGQDRNGDGKVNDRDHRRALVLSPYRFEFQDFDPQGAVPILAATRGYGEENVEYRVNAWAGWESFLGWEDFDVVVVATHGGRVCGSDGCRHGLNTGDYFDTVEEAIALFRRHNVPGMMADFAQAVTSGERFSAMVSADFFTHPDNYPEGLHGTVVIAVACESANRPGEPFDLGDALVNASPSSTGDARGGVWVGWTETVWSDDATAATEALLEYLSRGLTARDALSRIALRGLHQGVPVEGGPVPEVVVRTRGSGDLRIRELPWLLDDFFAPLPDGGDLTWAVVGSLGDGEPNRLDLELDVDGVMPGTEGGYRVRFELDGERVGSSYSLAGSDAWDLFTREAFFPAVPMGRDLVPWETYTLEAIVELPEGGESRTEVRNVEFRVCEWTVTWQGPQDPQPLTFHPDDFERAIMVPLADGSVMARLSFDDSKIVVIWIHGLSPGNGGPFTASLSGNAGLISPSHQYGDVEVLDALVARYDGRYANVLVEPTIVPILDVGADGTPTVGMGTFSASFRLTDDPDVPIPLPPFEGISCLNDPGPDF